MNKEHVLYPLNPCYGILRDTNKNQIKGILSVTPQDTSKLPSYEYLHNLAINQATKIYMLRQIIDKAIECINEMQENAKYEITTLTVGDRAYYEYVKNIFKNLLEILKEVDEYED